MIYRILEFIVYIGDFLYDILSYPYKKYETYCEKNYLCPYCRKPLKRRDDLLPPNPRSLILDCKHYRVSVNLKKYFGILEEQDERDWD